MTRTVLQIPMTADLRINAEKAAIRQGFSSLQEAVRLFLAKFSRNEISVGFEKTIHLSSKAIKRYNRLTHEIKQGKGIYQAENVDDFLDQLYGRKNPVSKTVS